MKGIRQINKDKVCNFVDKLGHVKEIHWFWEKYLCDATCKEVKSTKSVTHESLILIEGCIML